MNSPAVVGEAVDRTRPLPTGQRIRAFARFALALTIWVGAVAIWVRSGFAVPPVTFMASPLPVAVAFTGTALYGVIGLAITLRRPEVRTGRLLAWAAVIEALLDLTWAYLALAETTTTTLPIDPAAAAWLSCAVAFPVAAAVIIPLAAIFPTDRPESRTGRHAMAVAVAAAALVLVGSFLRPGRMPFITRYQSPFGSAGVAAAGVAIEVAGYALLVAASLMVAQSQLARYRRADAVTRAQLRVFAGTTAEVAVAFVIVIVTSIADLGTPALRDLIGTVNNVGISLVPLAVLAAVARYRLYEIDRLVSRGFLYGALTAIVAGLTAASIQLLTALSKLVTGGSSEVVVVFTTLILVSVFAPIKARLEKVAARVTRDPTAPATEVLVRPSEFDDPAFLAAFDARTRAVLAAERGREDEREASSSAP